MVKNSSANAGDVGSIPGSGRSSGEGNGNPLQCSYLEIPWISYIVHGAENLQLNNLELACVKKKIYQENENSGERGESLQESPGKIETDRFFIALGGGLLYLQKRREIRYAQKKQEERYYLRIVSVKC